MTSMRFWRTHLELFFLISTEWFWHFDQLILALSINDFCYFDELIETVGWSDFAVSNIYLFHFGQLILTLWRSDMRSFLCALTHLLTALRYINLDGKICQRSWWKKNSVLIQPCCQHIGNKSWRAWVSFLSSATKTRSVTCTSEKITIDKEKYLRSNQPPGLGLYHL